MFSVTEERLREIIEYFNDWEWCKCNDCRVDCHSHAVNTDASLTKLADYVIKELKNERKDGPESVPPN